MALTEAQVLAAEIERVDPTVAVLFDRDSTFLASIEDGEFEVTSARDVRVPMEIRTGGNFKASTADGGDLGRGDAPQYEKLLVPTYLATHAVEWNKLTEWVTDDTRKAVINAFQRNVASAMPEFRRQIDNQLMTAGQGVLGTITTVAVAGGNDTYTMTTDGFRVRLTRFGQTINVYNAALTVRRTTGDGSKINLHDIPQNQIRVPSVAGAIATDKIVAGGLTATPPTWISGIQYHNDDAATGSYFSLDRALNPEIRANRVNAGAAFDLPFVRLLRNKVGDRIGQNFRNMKAEVWMHPAQVQAYEELAQLVSIINKDAKAMGVDLYFNDNMQMAGAPVRSSFSWDRTRIDLIEKMYFKRAFVRKPGFYTASDGRKFFEIRGASGGVATADIFYLAIQFNLYTTNPPAGGFVSNLTVPSGY